MRREQIIFEITGIPTAKGRPRFARIGNFVRAYTPGKTRAQEADVLAQALPYKPKCPIDTAIGLDLIFYMPIPKSMPKKYKEMACLEKLPVTTRPDLDNLEKLILDALNGVFWTDDSRVAEKHSRKVYSHSPRIEVKVVYGAVS